MATIGSGIGRFTEPQTFNHPLKAAFCLDGLFAAPS
jgi:hypothetical protein